MKLLFRTGNVAATTAMSRRVSWTKRDARTDMAASYGAWSPRGTYSLFPVLRGEGGGEGRAAFHVAHRSIARNVRCDESNGASTPRAPHPSPRSTGKREDGLSALKPPR